MATKNIGKTAANVPGKKAPAAIGKVKGRGRVEPKVAVQRATKQMKSFRLATTKIKRARKILRTTTDTGTIEAALDMVVFRQELLDGLDAMAGVKILTPEEMDAVDQAPTGDDQVKRR